MSRLIIRTPGTGSSTLRDRRTTIAGSLRIINSDESYDATVSTADSPVTIPDTEAIAKDSEGNVLATTELASAVNGGEVLIPDKTYTDSDGSSVTVAAGAAIVCQAQTTDLTIEIQVADTSDTAGPFTIKANSEGTISAVDAGVLTSLVIEVNGSPVTAPFTLVEGDTVEFAYDTATADTVITLTGSY